MKIVTSQPLHGYRGPSHSKENSRTFSRLTPAVNLYQMTFPLYKMTLPLRTTASLILAAAATTFTGCSSVAYDTTGETVAVYQFGEFKMLLNTTALKAARAAKPALQQLDLYQTESVVNRFNARLTARARNDQRILVIIQEVNSAQTLVRIRWGEAGNLNYSRQLFDTIESNLGK